jgi:malate/lactate dehydrogenase
MKISIIGASGNVGSNAAFNLMAQKLADELVLIDEPRPGHVAVHALDMNTAATGMDILVRAGSPADMRDSDIVIMAAGSAQTFASRMEVLPANLPIIKSVALNIKKYCPGAIVIMASNPVCPLNYAMYRISGFDRMKVIGYSFNDSIRFRMRVAAELGVKSPGRGYCHRGARQQPGIALQLCQGERQTGHFQRGNEGKNTENGA